MKNYIYPSIMDKQNEAAKVLTIVSNDKKEKSFLTETVLESIYSQKQTKTYEITSKPYKNRLAKAVAWDRDEENNLTISFCEIPNEENADWTLLVEYLFTKDQIDAFIPIYEYNKQIATSLNTIANESVSSKPNIVKKK